MNKWKNVTNDEIQAVLKKQIAINEYNDKLEFVADVINDVMNHINNCRGHEAANIAYDILDIYHQEWADLKKLQHLIKVGLNEHFRLEPAILELAERIVKERDVNLKNVTWYRTTPNRSLNKVI